MFTKLNQSFYALEDHFFKAISIHSETLTTGTSIYITGVPAASLNFCVMREPCKDYLFVISKALKRFQEHEVEGGIIIRENIVNEKVKEILAKQGLCHLEESIAMVLDMQELPETHVTDKEGVIEEIPLNRLEEWMQPLTEAFGSTEEITRAYKDTHIRAMERASSFWHYTLLLEGQPISSLTLSTLGDFARIDDVATLPAFQGRGYATKLIKKVLHLAAEKQISHCFLEASHAGQGVYKRLGFQKIFTNFIYGFKE